MDKLTVILPSIVGVIYFVNSLIHLSRHEYSWFLIWFGYALAQIGLVIAGNKA